MILKASEFKFPDALRAKFPVIVRGSPPEGWPGGVVLVSEGKVPYRNFLQIIGAAPVTEFEAQIGEYRDNDPRMILSMIEEISLNCPLRVDEVETIKNEYQTASDDAGESRPPIFVQGLISPVFHAFENGMLSFPSALSLSLYTCPDAQREIIGLKFADESAEIVLRHIADPFYAGDILNRLAREPARLKILGYDNLRIFLKERSPFSYGRSRFLMRLAAAIPAQKREGLTSDHGELLLNIDQKKRQALFRGESISIDGKSVDFKQLITLNRERGTTAHSKNTRGKAWHSGLKNIAPVSIAGRLWRTFFRMTATMTVFSSSKMAAWA